MSQADYQARVKVLSDRLIALQQPIRILDAIKWPARFEQDFLASGGTQLPPVDRDYYERITLNFQPYTDKPMFIKIPTVSRNYPNNTY